MRYLVLIMTILMILIIGCGNEIQTTGMAHLPDFLSKCDKENSRITWYAADFIYKHATINMKTGATVITIQLTSGEEKQINGGNYFSNLLFQDGSVHRILKPCDPAIYPCIDQTWAYEKKAVYTVSNTAYCPSSQEFCRNVVDYYMEHTNDCGALEGIDMRCLNEDWEKDLEPLGEIGRVIK